MNRDNFLKCIDHSDYPPIPTEYVPKIPIDPPTGIINYTGLDDNPYNKKLYLKQKIQVVDLCKSKSILIKDLDIQQNDYLEITFELMGNTNGYRYVDITNVRNNLTKHTTLDKLKAGIRTVKYTELI